MFERVNLQARSTMTTTSFTQEILNASRYSYVFEFELCVDTVARLGMEAGMSLECAKRHAIAALVSHKLEGLKNKTVKRSFPGFGDGYTGTIVDWDYESQKYVIEWSCGCKSKQYWMTHDHVFKYLVEE